MAASTTGTYTAPVMEYWNNYFLNELRANLVLEQFGLKGLHPKNNGAMVHWQTMTDFSAATTALAEATADTNEYSLSGAMVTATVTQYGAYVKISDLLQDVWLAGSYQTVMERLARHAALTIDTVIRDSCFTAGGTAQYGGTAVARNSIASDGSFDMDLSEVRMAVNSLETLKAPRWPDGFYVGVVHQDVKYDLQGDTANWQDVLKFIPGSQQHVIKGEVGEMYGVRFIMSQQALAMDASGSASTDVYQSYIFGPEHYGISELQGVQTIIKNPSPVSQLDTFGTVGWKVGFVSKQLDASRMIRIESGASLGT